MKKIIFLLSTLFVAMQGNTQPITAQDMMDLVTCRTDSCVTNRLLPKGYEAGNVKETEDFSLYEYFSSISEPYSDNERVVLPNRVEYTHTGKAYIIAVNYLTGNKQIHDGVMKDFAARGFVPVEDSQLALNNLRTAYMSAEYPAMRLLVTTYNKTVNEQQFTEYGFKLKWMPDPPRNDLEAHKAMFQGE